MTHLSRRDLLSKAARMAFGLSVLPVGAGAHELTKALAQAPKRPTATSVIWLTMSGGMSHLDTFDPKPQQHSIQGPVSSIATAVDGIQLTEYLPQLAQRMHHCAVLSGMTSTQGAHEPGRYTLRTGHNPQTGLEHPSLGSWLMHYRGRLHPELPGHVVINGGSRHPGAGSLDPIHAPLPLSSAERGLPYQLDLSEGQQQDFRRKLDLTESLESTFLQRMGQERSVKAYKTLYHEAIRLLHSRDLSAYDISVESEQTKQRYGSHAFGQGCLLARRLVEHGTRFIEVSLGGWDTHQDNFTQVADQSLQLDQGLSALLDDLHDRGMLSECLVVVGTEFGRSPKITRDQGRNHHPSAFSCMLAGGGVQGGQRYGSTDERGMHVTSGRMTLLDLHATIGYALGLPIHEVLYNAQGRPLSIAGSSNADGANNGVNGHRQANIHYDIFS